MDRISLTSGWLMGSRIAGQRSKKTITGYSYNGTVLPALPEWDRAKYPHAYLSYMQGALAYTLYCFPSALVVREQGGMVSTDGENLACWTANYLDIIGDWFNLNEREFLFADGRVAYTPLWCNTDLYNKDGTLYLSASDPIPVYA